MKIIHLLNWKMDTIEKELENIKRQGFDAIQINPVQPFKEEESFKWYSSYQPLGFRIGNMFGDKEDLKRLCALAKEKGIDIIVDVVLNHTANKSNSEPLLPHETVDQELRNEKSFWKPRIQMHDGDNRWEATNYCIGLPGLDLSNEDLQEIIFAYLKELKECGVKGIRFDAAKHFGLPKDGVNFLKKVRRFMLLNNMYGYGEFLGGDKEWRDEFAELLMISAPCDTTIENVNRLITFFESHDTYLNVPDTNPDLICTRYLDDDALIYTYRKIRSLYKNSVVYVRPNHEDNPFCNNANNLSCDEVYKLDERDYFGRLYFESDDIREINKIKTLRLNK